MTKEVLGIIVPKTIGIGDAVQFTSVPENYFKKFGRKVVDVERHWVFDYNPYIVRSERTTRDVRLWNFSPVPKPRGSVFLSLAEKHAACVGVQHVTLRHPKLYRYEEHPFHLRRMILLQVEGVSHGRLPKTVLDHILMKYQGPNLYQIGLKDEGLGIPWIPTRTAWDLAELISRARMVIGPDSGPTWIATCYPDVVVKKVRMKPTVDALKTWVPLDVSNLHAQWDDLQLFSVYNPSVEDVGFTSSYKRI